MLRIVIGQRGWVWIGNWAQDGDEVTLSDARCIRRWGTPGDRDVGLGKLALEGPQPQTILDQAGTVYLHRLAIVGALAANEEAWAGK